MIAHRKYPWDEWFGRPSTVLVRRVHYRCSQSTMAQTIRNNASARGLRVHLTDTGTEILIELRGAVGGAPNWTVTVFIHRVARVVAGTGP